MNIIDLIKQRHSVRSYTGQLLTPEQEHRLLDFVGATTSPFGGSVTIRLKAFDMRDGYKPSTYGMIKGAMNFFLIGMGSDEESALSVGYRFEQVVLKALELGLGTCWIAGTFKGSDFNRGEEWPAGEELKIISPVGIPAKQRLFEKVGRKVMGSDRRKPFGELFFSHDFSSSLSPDSHFGEPLEMMRLAPSSTNSQPWRALVDGNTVHFYYVPKSAVSVLDCGIALCHFHLTQQYFNRPGSFFIATDTPAPPSSWRYLRSYREKRYSLIYFASIKYQTGCCIQQMQHPV